MQNNPRWLIRRDVPEAVAIAKQTAGPDEKDMLSLLRDRDHIGLTIDDDQDKVASYLIYRVQEESVVLMHMGTHPDKQRLGYGTALIQHVIKKLSPLRQRRVDALVWEYNTPLLLFLRQQGFYSIGMVAEDVVMRHWWDGTVPEYQRKLELSEVICG